MAYVGDTGVGMTITLATTGAVGCVRTATLPEWVMEKIDATCLDSAGFIRYIPGDLTDPGDVTMEAIFEATLDIPAPGVVEDITITFPIGDDTNTVPATLTGSGFLASTQLPTAAVNELMTLNLTFSFDGDTGPAYTIEAAA